MKAPNGEPTNLTEEQWANVRTKAFKDWFGDWELVAKSISEAKELTKPLIGKPIKSDRHRTQKKVSRAIGFRFIKREWDNPDY